MYRLHRHISDILLFHNQEAQMVQSVVDSSGTIEVFKLA